MNQNASIGEKIKALRTSQNLTLKQLSEKTNLSTGFLSQMERGMSSIAIDTLEKIAGVLGVSCPAFFQTILRSTISQTLSCTVLLSRRLEKGKSGI